MRFMKLGVFALAAIMLFSACDPSNKTKGGVIGGTAGAALGGLVGNLIAGKGDNKTSRTLFGAAIGGAVGTAAGVLIGNKMDKAKAAAAAVNNAEVETITDANGLEGVKVTFDSGILFATGKSDLSQTAKKSLDQFVANVLIPYSDTDVAIQGHTDNQGFKGVTDPSVNAQKTRDLSLQRASAVSSYLLGKGIGSQRITKVEGLGQDMPVADNSTKAGQQQNRRVEVYLYASKAMIDAANAGTLQ